MSKMRVTTHVVFLMLVVFASAGQAQIYTPLYELGTNKGDPTLPQGVFAQGRDGNLYSTSSSGGANGFGAVFQLTPSGTMNVLHSFARSEGIPYGGLTLGTDGSLYGVTVGGGLGYGTVFKISTGGLFSPVHNFNGTTEGAPSSVNAAPIQGTDGKFYGTAANGYNYYGTFYKMTTAGVMTPLYEFPGSPIYLRYPTVLLQGTDGNFYGITAGANSDHGMVYKITPQGKLKVLHAFAGGSSDGAAPTDLIQASDGNFYGTTQYGGPSGHGAIFQMSPAGQVTILQFSQGNGNFPGLYPQSLVQATDGLFYGSASADDNSLDNCSATYGLLFQITASGHFTDLFCNFKGANGTHPDYPLLQHTNGTFYSATYEGGTGAGGVLYSLDVGLDPFVTFLPAQSVAKVGTTIGILGQGFSGTTKVSFNGTAASFTVSSDTFLTAKVPNGATTGPISVTTPGGTLASNQQFRVPPQIKSFTPTSGPVGTLVTISGLSLTQTTKVTCGVKAASFTVVNDMTVTATVPSGAKTGKIVITTAGGIAKSPTSFTVTQ